MQKRITLIIIFGMSFLFGLAIGIILPKQSLAVGPFPPSKYVGIFSDYNGFSNGQVKRPFYYRTFHPKYTGIWMHMQNGLPTVIGQYEDGYPCGTWVSFDMKGNINYLEMYSSQTESELWRFDPNGQIKAKSHYQIFYNDDSATKKEIRE